MLEQPGSRNQGEQINARHDLPTGSHSAAPPRLDLKVFDLPVTEWIPATAHWFASMGKPFAVGLILLALILAVAGYLLVIAAWRAHVVLLWRKRQRSRARSTHK